jgi:hypothetical protein
MTEQGILQLLFVVSFLINESQSVYFLPFEEIPLIMQYSFFVEKNLFLSKLPKSSNKCVPLSDLYKIPAILFSGNSGSHQKPLILS